MFHQAGYSVFLVDGFRTSTNLAQQFGTETGMQPATSGEQRNQKSMVKQYQTIFDVVQFFRSEVPLHTMLALQFIHSTLILLRFSIMQLCLQRVKLNLGFTRLPSSLTFFQRSSLGQTQSCHPDCLSTSHCPNSMNKQFSEQYVCFSSKGESSLTTESMI